MGRYSSANNKHKIPSNGFGRNNAIFSLVQYKRKCDSVSVSDINGGLRTGQNSTEKLTGSFGDSRILIVVLRLPA